MIIDLDSMHSKGVVGLKMYVAVATCSLAVCITDIPITVEWTTSIGNGFVNTGRRQECILALSLHSLEDSRPGSCGPYVFDRGLQPFHAHVCGLTKNIITNGSAWMQAVNSGVPTRCTMAGFLCTRAFVQSASCLHTFRVLLACTPSRDASYMHAESVLALIYSSSTAICNINWSCIMR